MSASNLIILGPQGSGKTTQAELLAKTLGFALFGAGDALREIAREDTELGRKVRRTINVEGRLVEPELISEVIKGKVATVPKGRGLVLDGYPRSMTQYELFKKFWPETGRGDYQVVFIELPDEEAVKRLTGRVTCENCGAVYVEGTMEKCARCGGRLVKRPDDTPEAIQRRLQSFYSETMPMIRAMEADRKVLHIDGAPSIDEVHRKIVEKLQAS
ncbi:MAG TPA: nucleoside monophosphate kinase [Terriglobia bacterium]|nr:nucleoside monophosphate kinase [Terriglobia bacterium]